MPWAESWVSRRNCSPPGTKTSAWRGRSAPPDSTRSSSGRRFSSATSMARKQLADRRRAGRAAAHGRVVGDDEALGVRHLGQGHHDAAADRVAGVQPGQRAQLEHRRAGVDQRLQTLAHQHLAAGPVALHVLRAAAGEDVVVQRRAPRRPARPWRRRCRGTRRPRRPGGTAAARSCGRVPGGPALLQERVHAFGGLGSRRTARPTWRRPRPALRPTAAPAASGAAPWWPAPHPGAAWRSAVVRSATQASSAASSGVTAVSRPAATASAAPKRSPVRVARARKRRSTTRSAGTRIMAGATPTRTSVKAKVAASAATAMSAAAMRPMPPARAWPLTRTMTGTALSTMDVRMAGMRLGAAVPRSDRSAPEQNTVPVPVSTTARTSGSPVASRNACSSCANSAADSALRLAGESSVSVRIPSSCCTPTNTSVTGAQCRGRPTDGRKRAGGIVRR